MTLHELISHHINNLDDPRDIAEVTAKHTPEHLLHDYYTEALVPVVREVLRAQRNTAMRPRRTTMPPRSAKLAARRDWWTEFLNARLCVDNEWKKMADCSPEDLLSVAAERRENAARNIAVAEYMEELAAVMRRYGVNFVRDLPERVVAALVNG